MFYLAYDNKPLFVTVLHKKHPKSFVSNFWGAVHGGVIVVKDIEISDEEGTEGSGSFDVTVDGWGDYIDVELPLN